ncbi:tetratricopeptide repeat protein [Kutzneria albida]|uniref:NB-ARC domain-containing protein n=1 Tax=Kutzneria albida DSM 43870 TaxID=1449976 RepID=W5WEK8_9PSEU|nr:tetratricopeptide repeat protein [Kutzneria albida]AHH99175.1 hypothetical protein KALB_5814 [Kutzneria albida DSM 43870]
MTGAEVEVGGNNSGIVSIGDQTHNEQHQHLPPTITPMEQVDAPVGLVNLPESPALFVGRDEDVDRLHAVLTDRGSGPVTVAVVHGLGGVGKSTLAAHYAREHLVDYQVVWWIAADSAAEITAGLAELAVRLQPQLATLPHQVLPGQALRWLSTHDKWLLLLDNVNDRGDVELVLGGIAAGRVLLTSRRATGWQGVAALPLDVLGHDDAVDLLTSTAGPSADLPGARALCGELGCLPLAVRQAGAYLAETMTSATDYLDLLTRQPAAVYQEATVDWVEPTMARVWRVSMDRLASTPLAVEVLRVLAWMAPELVPRPLLDGMDEDLTVRRAVGRLHAYSMITATGTAVSVHRLVQAVTRTPDPADPHRGHADIHAAREQATRLLSETVQATDPRAPSAVPVLQPLLPHIQALADRTEAAEDTLTTANLLNHTSAFLGFQGRPDLPERYARRALAATERLLGHDHPDTLTCRSNLAFLLEANGEGARAAEIFADVLADRERVLGPDHRDTLTSRNNLAAVYEALGDLDRAIPLLESTLADCERVLGPDDVDTVGSRNALAYAYESAGRLDQALGMYEQVLADCTRLLGPDHHFTLLARNNLVCAKAQIHGWASALDELELLVADRTRVLGAEHPDTIVSRTNLAVACGSVGEWDRAMALHEAVLADCERVLGTGHPATATAAETLATARERSQQA